MPITGLLVANRFRFNARVPERELQDIIDLKTHLDFDRIVPMPLNVYRGGMSERDRETFPLNWADWRLENWGTVYGPVNKDTRYANDTTICFHFDTHNKPPFPIAAALANRYCRFVSDDWVLEHTWAVIDDYEGISSWAIEYWKGYSRSVIKLNEEPDKRPIIELFDVRVDDD